MATVTAGALIVAGLRRANVIDSPTGFIQHPASGGGEAFDYLNAALSELFDIIYEADSEAYKSTKVTFPTVATVADTNIQTLATNLFYHLRAIEYFNGLRWVGLDRINFADRNDWSTSGTPEGYALDGDNVTIYPTPAAIYSMRAIFVPMPPTTAADVDSVDIQGPWREFVERHFAKQCMEKKKIDASAHEAALYGTPMNPGGLAGRIRSASKKRDAGQPIAPVDVQGDYDPWSIW